MPLIAAAIGVGLGGLKYFASDKPKANRDRQLAGDTQRLTPWTGLTADKPQDADLLGNMMTFGSTGASLGQNIDNSKAQNNLTDKMAGYYDRGGPNGIANKASFGDPSSGAPMQTTTVPAAKGQNTWGDLKKEDPAIARYRRWANGGSSYS